MRETFEIKRWRRDAEKWDEEWKPERIEANRALQSVELVFSVGILSIMGAAVFTGAEQVVELFTRDPTTIGYAIDFTRAFAVSMLSVGVFYPLAGSLVGAGDTRTPMYARFVGVVIFLLAGSFLLGVTLDLGLVGVYVGVVFSFVSWALIVAAGFQWGGWQELAERMIEERSNA
jgi:Na+-driven multidrug efflux pump